ncbi:hypothetical protein OUZ56_001380 [Daphnia magna]|uniref:Uncharacterized protein n=1 Tax=Daphnia magna TaxID=35525 RepID=A0ABR0A2G1_9CRUS|nr:hypothetical protein OUZ56_001380 [Daphnia magna]
MKKNKLHVHCLSLLVISKTDYHGRQDETGVRRGGRTREEEEKKKCALILDECPSVSDSKEKGNRRARYMAINWMSRADELQPSPQP